MHQRTQILWLLCESCEFNKLFVDSKNLKDLNDQGTSDENRTATELKSRSYSPISQQHFINLKQIHPS